ncbi:MAG: NUDIX hydrolase [Chloroflexi bacterium]|nr:hypothetical protein [Anaerolineaceae bacterium]NMB89289.1 NUDIX hydrolase [Chloroflexota bacterium]
MLFSLRDNRLFVLLTPADEQLFPGAWELPGCPFSSRESLEKNASQCIAPFTGQHEAYLEQLYSYGDSGRHPSLDLLSIVYFALLSADALSSGRPADVDVRWFPLDQLPPLAMKHGDFIEYALRRLRYKLEYSAVGFELLPEYFSLSELQHTYEVVLGEKLDKRNFRRRILQANVIEPTQQYRLGEGRPARLYRYRPDAVAEVKARRLFP